MTYIKILEGKKHERNYHIYITKQHYNRFNYFIKLYNRQLYHVTQLQIYYETVNHILTTERDIDIDVLRQHIEDLKTFDDEYYRADMELKLKSMSHEPTPLELTMTRYQLYLAKSPLWARDLTPEDIYYISLTSEEDIEDEFKKLE